jgi:hypothetical protein
LTQQGDAFLVSHLLYCIDAILALWVMKINLPRLIFRDMKTTFAENPVETEGIP